MTDNEVCCYIGLGSNIGDGRVNLNRAIELMKEIGGIRVTAVASFYRTAPVGYTEQDYFINTVAEIYTSLTPSTLLNRLQQIENSLGRVRVIRWGPRTVDLDILLYGNQTITLPELEIPHPRMHQRAFVLAPLADLNPDFVINGERAADLVSRLAAEQQVEKLC